MKCPVCRNSCDAAAHSCSICGFDRINLDFLNVDDAEAGKRYVEYAKTIWFMNENYDSFSHFNPGCDTIKRTLLQLNAYFHFSEQLEHIRQNPTDFTARSWFIDCLREIYVLNGTFPVTSKKYVKGIIEEHMTFFEKESTSPVSNSEYMMTEHLIHRAEMALADCDFTSAFRYYQQYLFAIKRLKETDYLAQIDEAARCVLHNCQVLCELLTIDPQICKSIAQKADEYYNHDVYETADGRALLQSITEREREALYVHTLGCGLSGAYYTETDDSWTIGINKTHDATYESCTFDYGGTKHFSAYDLSSLGCGLVPIEWVNGLMYRIQYITNAFSISDAIYLHKDSVEQLARKLTAIHGLFN